jgi:hypothetical protein
MRTQDRKSRRPVTRIAGVALVVSCAAGIAGFIKWIPASIGSPNAIVTPAGLPSSLAQGSGADTAPLGIGSSRATCPDCGVIEPTRETGKSSDSSATDRCPDQGNSAAATTGSTQTAENADLALLLDWHLNARNGYSPLHHGIGCVPQAGLAVPLRI